MAVNALVARRTGLLVDEQFCATLDPQCGSMWCTMSTSGLRIRVEPELRKQFIAECRQQGLSASQVVRLFMRQYVNGALRAELTESSANEEKKYGQT